MTGQEIQDALAAPFPDGTVHFKPQAMSKDNTKALAVAYIDARDVMDRLDEVVGIGNWQDSYEPIPGTKEVRCRLSVRIDGEWITKEDVGGQSAQPDAGDREKSAFSAALKRAAVKWGIGRQLYRLKMGWLPYDSQKKRFDPHPRLPAQFLRKEAKPVPAARPAPVATDAGAQEEPPAPRPREAQAAPSKSAGQYLYACCAKASEAGLLKPGELALEAQAALKGALGGDPDEWGPECKEAVKRFVADFMAAAKEMGGNPNRKVDGPEVVALHGRMAPLGMTLQKACEALGWEPIKVPDLRLKHLRAIEARIGQMEEAKRLAPVART